MSFFDMSVDEIEASEPIFFTPRVPVQMTVLSIKENPKYNSINLTCNVEDGEHAAKKYELAIMGGENPHMRKKKAAFLLAFWSKEDLRDNKASLDTLIGQRFQVRPDTPYTSEKSGKVIQGFEGFTKLEQPEASASNLPF